MLCFACQEHICQWWKLQDNCNFYLQPLSLQRSPSWKWLLPLILTAYIPTFPYSSFLPLTSISLQFSVTFQPHHLSLVSAGRWTQVYLLSLLLSLLLLNQQPPCSFAFPCSPGSPFYTPWNLVQKTKDSEAYPSFHSVPRSSAGGRGPEYTWVFPHSLLTVKQGILR